MCDQCEPIEDKEIHIVKFQQCSGDHVVRCVITTNQGMQNPISLADQISAQTGEHIEDLKEWYSEGLEANPESDDLERFVNLVAHAMRRYPEDYVSNLLARAIQQIVRDDGIYNEIRGCAKDLKSGVEGMVAEMEQVKAERDMLRDLVIRYQSAESDEAFVDSPHLP